MSDLSHLQKRLLLCIKVCCARACRIDFLLAMMYCNIDFIVPCKECHAVIVSSHMQAACLAMPSSCAPSIARENAAMMASNTATATRIHCACTPIYVSMLSFQSNILHALCFAAAASSLGTHVQWPLAMSRPVLPEYMQVLAVIAALSGCGSFCIS